MTYYRVKHKGADGEIGERFFRVDTEKEAHAAAASAGLSIVSIKRSKKGPQPEVPSKPVPGVLVAVAHVFWILAILLPAYYVVGAMLSPTTLSIPWGIAAAIVSIGAFRLRSAAERGRRRAPIIGGILALLVIAGVGFLLAQQQRSSVMRQGLTLGTIQAVVQIGIAVVLAFFAADILSRHARSKQ